MPRVVFRRALRQRLDEKWDERPVRPPDSAAGGGNGGGGGGGGGARLAYVDNSSAFMNSNLINVLLRDHGYTRARPTPPIRRGGPSIGTRPSSRQRASQCCHDAAHQREQAARLGGAHAQVAPLAGLRAMQRRHGVAALGLAPPSFVLPAEQAAFVRCMRRRFAEQRAAPLEERDIWILKPEGMSRGIGIYLHRPSPEGLGWAAVGSPLSLAQMGQLISPWGGGRAAPRRAQAVAVAGGGGGANAATPAAARGGGGGRGHGHGRIG